MERFRKLGTVDPAHVNGAWALASVSPGSKALGDFVTGGCDGKMRMWKIQSDSETPGGDAVDGEADTDRLGPCKQLGMFSGHSLPIVNIAVAKGCPTAASTSLDGTVKIWNLAVDGSDAKSIQQLNVAESWGISMSSDGQRVITGGANGVVQIIDTAICGVEQTFSIGHSQTESKESLRRESPMVMSVALSPDESEVAVGAQDGSVTVLDCETGKSIGGKFAKHGGPIRSISYLPSEPRTLVTASDDQMINLYDIGSGHVTGTCRGHTGFVLNARGSDNGSYIVSGGSDRSVIVWDRMMRESVYSYKGHKDSVWGVCYALGGNRIVSVSDDGTIGVLDSSNADKVQ